MRWLKIAALSALLSTAPLLGLGWMAWADSLIEDRDLSEWLDDAYSGSPETRAKAHQILVKAYRDEAHPIHRSIIANAFRTADGKNDEAIEILIEGLKDDHPEVRKASARSLGMIHPPREKTIQALIAALDHANDEAGWEMMIAIFHLVGFLKEDAILQLGELLNHPETHVRSRAAHILCLMGNRVPERVRHNAQAALDRINGQGLLKP